MSETIRLPEQFKARMEKELGPEYGAFIASYGDTRLYGLRCNLLKSNPKAFCEKMPFLLSKVEFAEAGFYYNDEERPGKHVYHEAGAYYIQEPSAMSAVTELDVKEGDIVLDLCAAPGGKSTQIASYLNGRGLLVTNEINKDRAVILSSNIERMGVRNAVVTSESSDVLARRFPLFFNKILVDAPCSGEGMFRKDETAVNEWSPENVSMCAKRQEEILKNAASMLAPGGTLVYSTCTFSREENEDNIEKFINENPDFELVLIKRLMPHKVKGEGHFVAKLKKKGEFVQRALYLDSSKGKKKSKNDSNALTEDTVRDFLTKDFGMKEEVAKEMLATSYITRIKDNVYLTPMLFNGIDSIRVVRPGLHIMCDLKNRFEPAHSLAMSMRPFEVTKKADISLDEAKRFIAGETISVDPNLKGFLPVFVNGFSIGFAKAVNGTLKNHYPKGLRTNL